jgi:hypothetical protein
MSRKKPKKGGLAIGFVAAVGVLSILTAVLLTSGSGIPVLQIPSQLPEYGGLLGRYAPSDALQVSYDNLTAIREINSTILANQPFLSLKEPYVTLNTSGMSARLALSLSKPNASIEAGFLGPAVFRSLASTFRATSAPSTRLGNFTLYSVEDRNASARQAYWITLIPKDMAIVYSPGALPALDALKQIIGVYNGSRPSILADSNMDRMLYAVNGTQGHLALGIQNFAGTVRSGQATLIAVDAAVQSAQVSYVVRFQDSTQAAAQTDAVKSAYISAHQFFRYDELVKAVEIQPLSNLRVALGVVG